MASTLMPRSCPSPGFPDGDSQPRARSVGCLTRGATLAAAFVLAGTTGAAGETPESDLRTALLKLADEQHFTIKNIHKIEDAPARSLGGESHQQLEALLQAFDYVVIRAPTGAIQEVLILGPSGRAPRSAVTPATRNQSAKEQHAAPTDPESNGEHAIEYEVAVEWKGEFRAVDALLLGRNGPMLRERLAMDPEGDAVALPASMMDAFGFQADDLEDGSVQTPYGEFEARLGRLKAVRVGEVGSHNVRVAFVEEGLLGGRRFLGMRVFRGYNVSIDDFAQKAVFATK